MLFVVGYNREALDGRCSACSAQFVPFVVTVVGIVGTDLLTGIGIGMAVAIFFILLGHRNSHFLQIEQAGEVPSRAGPMRLAEEVSFLNKVALQKELDAIEDGSSLILDASATRQIDYDALEIIEDFEENAGRRSITVERIGNFSPQG